MADDIGMICGIIWTKAMRAPAGLQVDSLPSNLRKTISFNKNVPRGALKIQIAFWALRPTSTKNASPNTLASPPKSWYFQLLRLSTYSSQSWTVHPILSQLNAHPRGQSPLSLMYAQLHYRHDQSEHVMKIQQLTWQQTISVALVYCMCAKGKFSNGPLYLGSTSMGR